MSGQIDVYERSCLLLVSNDVVILKRRRNTRIALIGGASHPVGNPKRKV
jgi:hypothetical protein